MKPGNFNPLTIPAVLFMLVSITVSTYAQSTDSSLNKLIIPQNDTLWETFCQDFTNIAQGVLAKKLNILFIGDSHIQGDYSTGRIRSLLAESNIKTGRGVVFPYSLAGTNSPEDYFIRSVNQWTALKWNTPETFTSNMAGYTISTNDTSVQLRFGYKAAPAPCFNAITLFHSAGLSEITGNEEIDSIGKNSNDSSFQATTVYFKNSTDSCTLNLKLNRQPGNFELYGVHPINNADSLIVHSLGINGISFQHYFTKINVRPWLNYIQPNCIILALGTNDIYPGRADTTRIKASIQGLIAKIRTYSPTTVIILTTPNDHLVRRKYPNRNLAPLTQIIKTSALKYNCAFWDFNLVMGGTGSVQNWHKHGLVYKDFIHLSKNGYKLQGELFFEAFTKAINLQK